MRLIYWVSVLFVISSNAFAFGDELARQKLPVDSTFRTPTKDGDEAISDFTAGKMDPMRYCLSLGMFLPNHIGFNNVTGTENVVKLVYFSEAAKRSTLIGIIDFNGFVVTHWEYIYEPSYRLNSYVFFKDGLPCYF